MLNFERKLFGSNKEYYICFIIMMKNEKLCVFIGRKWVNDIYNTISVTIIYNKKSYILYAHACVLIHKTRV